MEACGHLSGRGAGEFSVACQEGFGRVPEMHEERDAEGVGVRRVVPTFDKEALAVFGEVGLGPGGLPVVAGDAVRNLRDV